MASPERSARRPLPILERDRGLRPHDGLASETVIYGGPPNGRLALSFGTMGSGKSTVALQIHHNLASCGLRGLLLTLLDRDGAHVRAGSGCRPRPWRWSPISTSSPSPRPHPGLDYLVCDEAQFYTPEQCDQLSRVVDELGIDVFAFGLITDFRGVLFEGPSACSRWPTSGCRCRWRPGAGAGRGPPTTPRLVNGDVVYEGDVVVVGDTEPAEPALFGDAVTYRLLCRRHWRRGEAGPTSSPAT